MRQFHIFHATGKDRFTEKMNQPREYTGYVDAESLEEAFRLSQNVEEHWNKVNPCRSTSVGDVIQDDGTFYMVAGTGFTELVEPEENEPEHNYPE